MSLEKVTCCCILILLVPISHSTSAPDIEGYALIDLLRALNDSEKRITDWEITYRENFTIYRELQDNDLSGILPDYLGSLVELQSLNLARNNFTGPIPSNWFQLSNLRNLDLSSNGLSRIIPPQLFLVPTFNHVSAAVLFKVCYSSGVSCSNLFSSILWKVCTLGVCAVSAKVSKVEAFTISVSCGAFFLLLLGAIFTYERRHLRKLRNDVFVDVEGEDARKISFGQVRRFSWREVQLATDNFSENNVVGQGGFVKVYLGMLLDGTKVAVKRLSYYHNPGGEAAFLRELQLISVAVHRNLLPLLGFCTTLSERILIYPFMKNHSVAYRLRGYEALFYIAMLTLNLPAITDLKPGEEGLNWPATKRIKKLLREKSPHHIADRNLKTYDPEEVETILQLALVCAQSALEECPTMSEVVQMLEGVGLAERWAKREMLKEARYEEIVL
ncbi:putative LRR receptor-like serine/threonine-protein kinase [Drosera capensis]